MKRVLSLGAIFLLAAAASSPGVQFKGTLDEAFAKAKAENKLVLLDFSSYT